MPAISAAESQVMHVLWLHSPLSAEDIIATLDHADWHEKTVKTLLNRLLHKGAIRATRDGRKYLYTPVLQRADWQAEESRNLLDRVFGGHLTPMLAHFSQHETLSDKDLAELRKLVDSIEQRQGKES